jgi:hypothetical protein
MPTILEVTSPWEFSGRRHLLRAVLRFEICSTVKETPSSRTCRRSVLPVCIVGTSSTGKQADGTMYKDSLCDNDSIRGSTAAFIPFTVLKNATNIVPSLPEGFYHLRQNPKANDIWKALDDIVRHFSQFRSLSSDLDLRILPASEQQ